MIILRRECKFDEKMSMMQRLHPLEELQQTWNSIYVKKSGATTESFEIRMRYSGDRRNRDI